MLVNGSVSKDSVCALFLSRSSCYLCSHNFTLTVTNIYCFNSLVDLVSTVTPKTLPLHIKDIFFEPLYKFEP